MGQARQPKRSRQRTRGPVSCSAAVAGVIGLALLATIVDAAAQPGDRPRIALADTITVEPATQVPLPIRVGPPASVPRYSFIRVRGLPPFVRLSEGHSIAPGSWAIPLQALPTLSIELPPTASGESDFIVALVALDGSVLYQVKSTLVVRAPSAPAAGPATAPARILGATTAPSPVPAERAARAGPALKIETTAMRAQDREQALKFLKEGDEQVAQGNVAAARPLYELAAEVGLAQGALALGSTYDAAELARLNVRGIQPDPKEARRWYERARQLGASEADQRLLRLGAK